MIHPEDLYVNSRIKMWPSDGQRMLKSDALIKEYGAFLTVSEGFIILLHVSHDLKKHIAQRTRLPWLAFRCTAPLDNISMHASVSKSQVYKLLTGRGENLLQRLHLFLLS